MKHLNLYPNLSNQAQFRLKKVNEIKDYFIAMSKRLSKYNAAFHHDDSALIVLSATIGDGSVWIASARFSFCVFNNSRNCKETIKNNAEEKKNHNKIVIIARNKLNSIENTISKALIDNELTMKNLRQLLMKKVS